MKLNVKSVDNHKTWGKVIIVHNEILELEIPVQIGPRISALRFKNEKNSFFQAQNVRDYFNSKEWFPYGGHRFWHAPESHPRSYYPDNIPVQIKQKDGVLSIIQKIEQTTFIQKIIHIHLETKNDFIQIDHILINKGLWPVELACWAISMMAPGGTAYIPLPSKIPFPQALVANLSINIWPYTSLEDKRLSFSDHFIEVRQDSMAQSPIKIGANCDQNWIGYLLDQTFFLKKFYFEPKKIYPDRGSNTEIFTNNEMLEVETLGPLTILEPGEQICHTEEWRLGKISKMPENQHEMLNTFQDLL